MSSPPKRYDRDYFDRWYRRRRSRIESPAALRRRVALAVAMAERWLERPIRSALDVGCGEGRWRAELLRARPRLRYRGVEPSPYAVARFGRARGIVQGRFADLPALDLDGPYDLVVCSDVLHYLDDAELARGLPALVGAAGGLLYLEVLTAEEEIDGDRDGLVPRPAAAYARAFARLGLVGVGSHGWLAPALAEAASALERRTR